MSKFGFLQAIHKWTASSEFGTYRLCEQRRFRRACASTQSRQNLRCLLIQASESRGTFSQKARSLAPLNGWACAVKICHDGMLGDTNSLDGAQIIEEPVQALMKLYINHVHVFQRICIFEPRHEKTCLPGFRLDKTQTGLCSHRR